MSEPLIELRGVRAAYGTIEVLHGIDLAVMPGQVMALLGPNGAGKTSTLACVQGLRRPSAGHVTVGTYDVTRDGGAARALLGVQLQRTALFSSLTARELVRLYAALYNRFPSRTECDTLLARFGLADKAHARVGQLSGGQQQRLALALALINDPPVVLLDEPTAALDPQARRAVWTLVAAFRSEGRTVLLTTHFMDEAQHLCDRVGILDDGRLVALGPPADLIANLAPALAPDEAARRQPNLEDVFLALTGRDLAPKAE